MKVIRISDALHQQLKKDAKNDGRTLQWLVEDRLSGRTRATGLTLSDRNNHWETTPPAKNSEPSNLGVDDLTRPRHGIPPENTSEATPRVDDLFKQPAAITPPSRQLEENCCQNEHKPCKHWVWDSNSGEGYVNVLSGRTREVE